MKICPPSNTGMGSKFRSPRFKLMDAIKAGSWDTVIGKMEFDAKGDIKIIDYVVYKWDDKGGYAEVSPKGA